MVSLFILMVVVTLSLTLLISMRSFAAKQQNFTQPRQIARSAVDYLGFYLAQAADLNVSENGPNNPNALVMYYSFGKAKVGGGPAPTPIQASYNNLTVAQAAEGLGDEGTDIITLSVPTDPFSFEVGTWPSNNESGKNLYVKYRAGCPDSDKNLEMFKKAVGARHVGSGTSDWESGLLTIRDSAGTWRYFQITGIQPAGPNDCDDPNGDVIHVTFVSGQSDQINPPGGWEGVQMPPYYIKAGIDFTSFRVRNGNLEQKLSSVDPDETFVPGLFDPACDKTPRPIGCKGNGFTPIVENVEDLQIAYIYNDGDVWNSSDGAKALTTVNADGIPPQAQTAPGVIPTARDIVNVRALRVSIVGKSNRLDIGARGLSAWQERYRRPASEDRGAAGTYDQLATGVFDRYRLTTTLAIRNRMLGF